MTVTAKLMTAEELAEMPEDGNRYELVDGELIAVAPSFARHGRIAGRVVVSLGSHVESRGLGAVLVADAGFVLRRGPDTVRAPDAAFVRKGRAIEDAFLQGAPDLAVEVVSSSDRYSEVDAKVREYLRAGCRMVVVIDPRNETATVHTPSAATLLSIDDTIDGADVVPGWRLPLRGLFAQE
jgi:Uma2 family endonuclease